jgi:hypothetical protein
MRVKAATEASWHPEELLERRLARNATIWAALQRLGVQAGSEIRLDFFFQTGGRDADRELAEFLRSEFDHEVVVETDGISGRTRPMVVTASALDEWVRAMLYAGFEHGGCPFAGWSATVSRRAALPEP